MKMPQVGALDATATFGGCSMRDMYTLYIHMYKEEADVEFGVELVECRARAE